jgi:hypothetical protein
MSPGLSLSPRDDGFHKPTSPDDIWWTETCYFGFDLGGDRPLSLAIYPLFRPNMGVCSLAVHLWGNDGVQPWELPYSRFRWHIPMPERDLTDLSFEGLTYRVIEPLQRYLVAFDDPGRLTMELEYDGLDPVFAGWTQVDAASQSSGRGHFDQDCRVKGELILNGERIPVSTFGHRDRSWYSRPDNAPRRSASVTFGISDREQFLLIRPRTVGASTPASNEGNGGYLVREGVRAPIRRAERRVLERVGTRPTRFEIAITDDLGRTLEATGRANGTFAFNTSPPVFAWMTQVAWTMADGASYLGEDQEAYAFEEIRQLLRGAEIG